MNLNECFFGSFPSCLCIAMHIKALIREYVCGLKVNSFHSLGLISFLVYQ